MALKRVFKSHIQNCRFIFGNGDVAAFVGGRYLTDVDAEIQQLEKEVAAKNPTLYMDSAEMEVDPITLDPMYGIKQRIIAEFLAGKITLDPNRDMGTSQQGPLKVANSRDVAAITSGHAPSMVQVPEALNKALALLEVPKADAAAPADSRPEVDPDLLAGVQAMSVFGAAPVK